MGGSIAAQHKAIVDAGSGNHSAPDARAQGAEGTQLFMVAAGRLLMGCICARLQLGPELQWVEHSAHRKDRADASHDELLQPHDHAPGDDDDQEDIAAVSTAAA